LGGNLGLGVTPSAWSGLSGKVLEVGTAFGDKAALFQNDIDDLRLMSNVYFDGSFKYVRTGTATIFHSSNGSYKWSTAPSGTAGNAISFTQAMTLTANGRLLLGTTTESTFLLDVNGTARVSGAAYLATSSGSVGIGTTSVAEKLHVNGNVLLNSGYKIYGNSNAGSTSSYISLYNTTDGGMDFVTNFSTSKITFATAGNEHLRITSGGNVGIGTSSPSASAILQADSTTKGFLPPRGTNTQMLAIASPATGLMFYDTTNNKLNCYDGTTWQACW
jgi:hypothetical protein